MHNSLAQQLRDLLFSGNKMTWIGKIFPTWIGKIDLNQFLESMLNFC